METTIAETDSLRELSKLVGLPLDQLSKKIINSLIDERVISGDSEDFGNNINFSATESGYEILPLYKIVFGVEDLVTQEQVEFFGSLILIGTGDCPECGGDLETEYDGDFNGRTWEDKKCTVCDYAETNCPDFDTEPGGHDDY